jgi:hypothetical protein
MDADERQIFLFLKSFRDQFVSGREIARRASGKRRFSEEPQWAVPVLTRMLDRKAIETDNHDHFRLIQPKGGKKKWVSPQIKQVLEQSGKKFEDLEELEE